MGRSHDLVSVGHHVVVDMDPSMNRPLVQVLHIRLLDDVLLVSSFDQVVRRVGHLLIHERELLVLGMSSVDD